MDPKQSPNLLGRWTFLWQRTIGDTNIYCKRGNLHKATTTFVERYHRRDNLEARRQVMGQMRLLLQLETTLAQIDGNKTEKLLKAKMSSIRKTTMVVKGRWELNLQR